jgi:hypothetical protein
MYFLPCMSCIKWPHLINIFQNKINGESEECHLEEHLGARTRGYYGVSARCIASHIERAGPNAGTYSVRARACADEHRSFLATHPKSSVG